MIPLRVPFDGRSGGPAWGALPDAAQDDDSYGQDLDEWRERKKEGARELGEGNKGNGGGDRCRNTLNCHF
jgi:hypothetical protein